jgi:NADH-quinone oxidoreductase subunit A
LLESYFPILLFLAIGTAVGVGAIVVSGGLARLSGAHNPTARSSLPTNAASRLRGRAHEVRRALLPGRDPLHPLRPRDRVPLSLGHRAAGSRLVRPERDAAVPRILVVGFIYEWKKGALEWE